MVDNGSDKGTGGFGGSSGAGFGGGFGGGGGGGGGGQCITSPSPSAAYSKQQEAGLAVPSYPSAGGIGMPSSTGGIPFPGTGGPAVSSSGWNGMSNGTASSAGLPGVDNATFGSCYPGNPVAGSGMQYGTSGTGMGGTVNYLPTPGGTYMAGSGMNAAVGGGDGTAAMNIGSTAGANAAGGGFGVPECHNPLAGGVPVLPDVSAPLPLQE